MLQKILKENLVKITDKGHSYLTFKEDCPLTQFKVKLAFNYADQAEVNFYEAFGFENEDKPTPILIKFFLEDDKGDGAWKIKIKRSNIGEFIMNLESIRTISLTVETKLGGIGLNNYILKDKILEIVKLLNEMYF